MVQYRDSLNAASVELLLNAIADDTVFVLGAGASAPHVPTLGQIPERFASFGPQLGAYPSEAIPDSPLRQLIGPLIEGASTFEEYLQGQMTSETIGVLLEHFIAQAHWQRLPQYDVFGLFSLNSTVISYNWDGLAKARCPQTTIHPHGCLGPRLVLPEQLSESLAWSQDDDSMDFRDWLLPGLVMPGEEEAEPLSATRERILELWMSARSVVVIGYSFGLGYELAYDRVWFEAFCEAMTRNPSAEIHVLSPDAENIQGEIAERIDRSVNLHALPIRWHEFVRALLMNVR